MYALKKIGKICPKNSSQIKNSRFGIGLEKLDRDLYDPKEWAAYAKKAGM